jgi:glycoside/pentoside/hexuronide:cation symporter, GPH family
VPLRTRWGFAFGDIGNALSTITLNTWLLYYLVNIAGFAPVVGGALFLAGRLVDAVLDPVIGDLVDRHVARVPRLRWVRRSTLPFGTTFALLWLLPLLGGPSVLWALLGLVAHSLVFTTATMPMVSLTPVLAPTYDARTSLAGWRVGSGTLWALVAVSGPPALVVATTGESDLASSSSTGWLVMAVLYGVLMVVGYAIATRAIVEPAGATGPAPARLDRAVLAAVWRVRPLRSIIVFSLVLTVGVMVTNATLPFFLESVIGMTAGQQAASLGAFFLLAVAALPLWAAVARRVGKPRALLLGALVYAVALLLLAGLRPTPDELPALALVIALSSHRPVGGERPAARDAAGLRRARGGRDRGAPRGPGARDPRLRDQDRRVDRGLRQLDRRVRGGL